MGGWEDEKESLAQREKRVVTIWVPTVSRIKVLPLWISRLTGVSDNKAFSSASEISFALGYFLSCLLKAFQEHHVMFEDRFSPFAQLVMHLGANLCFTNLPSYHVHCGGPCVKIEI